MGIHGTLSTELKSCHLMAIICKYVCIQGDSVEKKRRYKLKYYVEQNRFLKALCVYYIISNLALGLLQLCLQLTYLSRRKVMEVRKVMQFNLDFFKIAPVENEKGVQCIKRA